MNLIGILILILIALVIAAAVAALAFDGNKSIVMKMLYALVTEAEKEFGGGTGSLKLASVMTEIYPKIPAIIKIFLSDKMLANWIEEALVRAKEDWHENDKISEYIVQKESK